MKHHPGTPANRVQGIPETPFIVRLTRATPASYGDTVDLGAFSRQEADDMVAAYTSNPAFTRVELLHND